MASTCNIRGDGAFGGGDPAGLDHGDAGEGQVVVDLGVFYLLVSDYHNHHNGMAAEGESERVY